MTIQGVPSSAHTGSAGTFFAIVVVQPSRNLAVAVVTNAGTAEAEAAVSEATLAMLQM